MRILVVEDNHRMAELISEGLNTAGYVTDTATSIYDAECFLQELEYDLMVLDVWLPDGNGRELLRCIRARNQSMPVLVVTATISTQQRIETLDEGADDYLGKPFDMEELVARVRAILRRPPQMAEAIQTISNLALDIQRLAVEIDGAPVDLARREFNALEVLVRNAGGLVPRRKLEQALYSYNEEVTPNALEAVVSRLRRKLDHAGALVTITAMRGIGYVLSERR